MTATHRAVDLAKAAAGAAADRIATDIVAIDVSDQLPLTDVFVLAAVATERQVGSVVDEIEDRLRPMGSKVVRREGGNNDRWVLLDFGDIVVHVQHEQERAFYSLERLWKDCPAIDLAEVLDEHRQAQ